MRNSLTSLLDRCVGVLPDVASQSAERVMMVGSLYKQYLSEEGWVGSFKVGAPVTNDGEPIPWFTYAAIDLLDEFLTEDLRVFEYGSGFSTIWFAERVAEVYGVEDDQEWVQRVRPQLPENGSIQYYEDKEMYISAPDANGPFDVIVIDGSHRGECIDHALNALTEGGCIIFDDYLYFARGDDEELNLDDFSQLIESDLNQLPLTSMKPLAVNKRRTDIFYPDDNCLGI